MRHIYGDKSEVTWKGNLNLGVTTVGSQVPLPVQVLEKMAAAGMITETVKQPMPEGAMLEVYEPVEAEPEPVAYAEPPKRPARTPMEQDLYDRLLAATGKKPS
jgi:hypothetical protein